MNAVAKVVRPHSSRGTGIWVGPAPDHAPRRSFQEKG